MRRDLTADPSIVRAYIMASTRHGPHSEDAHFGRQPGVAPGVVFGPMHTAKMALGGPHSSSERPNDPHEMASPEGDA